MTSGKGLEDVNWPSGVTQPLLVGLDSGGQSVSTWPCCLCTVGVADSDLRYCWVKRLALGKMNNADLVCDIHT